MRRRPDIVSLVAGLTIAALGTILLLDQLDALDLSLGYAAPAVLATVGAIVLTMGLTGPRRR